jgi:hypothetical protein
MDSSTAHLGYRLLEFESLRQRANALTVLQRKAARLRAVRIAIRLTVRLLSTSVASRWLPGVSLFKMRSISGWPGQSKR